MAIYEWADRLHDACAGISVNKVVDPQVVGDVIEQLAAKDSGQVTAKTFVDASRSRKSPTHPLFDWDDSSAAERFRLEQAKYVIRSIRVVCEKPGGTAGTVRAYQSVVGRETKTTRVYVSTRDAMQDEQRQSEVLQECLNQLLAWRRRWHELNEYAKHFKKIDAAIGDMQQLLASVD